MRVRSQTKMNLRMLKKFRWYLRSSRLRSRMVSNRNFRFASARKTTFDLIWRIKKLSRWMLLKSIWRSPKLRKIICSWMKNLTIKLWSNNKLKLRCPSSTSTLIQLKSWSSYLSSVSQHQDIKYISVQPVASKKEQSPTYKRQRSFLKQYTLARDV